MPETVRFYLDPGCPWAWQTSVWIREVEKVRDIEVEWRLFSLKLVNSGEGDDPFDGGHSQGFPAFRVLAVARQQGDNELTDRLYRALGEALHERSEKPSPDVVRAAALEAGLDEGDVKNAFDDPSLLEFVRKEHQSVIEEMGGFGVPTIVLESGKGIFGPVVATAPTGEAAGELWDHVRWLIETDGFYELKRTRDRRPGS